MFFVLLFVKILSILTCGVAAANITDCLNTNYYTKIVPFNGTAMNIVTTCASADNGNYIPFTLCNQNIWPDFDKELSQRIPKGGRLFIGLSDSYQTGEYKFMADGGYVNDPTPSYFIDTPDYNDTRKSCVALNFPGENVWRKQLSPVCDVTKSFNFICEAPLCPTLYKTVPLTSTSNLCYKPPAMGSIQQPFSKADQECKQMNGQLLQQATLSSYPQQTNQVATAMLQGSYGTSTITFWMGNGTCSKFDSTMYMERVTCDFRNGDNFFCMRVKSENQGSYAGCLVKPLDNPVYSSDFMQARFCISICQGKGNIYAGTRNRDCFCFDRKPMATREICSTSCPGNPGQPCGGLNSVTTHPTTVYFGTIGSTCTDFIGMGFYPAPGQSVTFKTKAGTTIVCDIESYLPPEGVTNFRRCPIGFVMINHTCLVLNTEPQTSNEAHRICQTLQSDLAYLNPQELQFIRQIVQRPWPFSRNDAYHIGSYSPRSKVWTWRDGTPMRNDAFQGLTVSKYSPTDGTVVTEKSSTYTLRYNNTIVDYIKNINPKMEFPFVCKWNEKYIGLQELIRNQGVVVEHHSTNMSVTACIQLCLNSKRLQIAQVKGDTCICSLSTINVQKPGTFDCQSPTFCSGNNGQICGCDGKASLYYVDPASTPRYFDCDSLLSNSIGVNGVYTLWPGNSIDGNQTTICTFSNGLCPDNMPISYRNTCYAIGAEAKGHKEAVEYCTKMGANIVNPKDEDEQRFVATLAKMNLTGQETWLGILMKQGTTTRINVTTQDVTNLYISGDQCSLLSSATGPSFIDCNIQKPFICIEGKFLLFFR